MNRIILNRFSRNQGVAGGSAGPVDPAFAAVGNSIEGLLSGDTDGAIWSGATGSFGNTYCNLYYPIQTAQITTMGYYCTQTTSDPLAGVKLGIFRESDGLKIAETAQSVAQVGGIFLPLITPVVLNKAEAYYLALACNENGARFLMQSGKWGGAGLPSLSFEIPNAMIPANYGLEFSNKRTYRYAIGAF